MLGNCTIYIGYMYYMCWINMLGNYIMYLGYMCWVPELYVLGIHVDYYYIYVHKYGICYRVPKKRH